MKRVNSFCSKFSLCSYRYSVFSLTQWYIKLNMFLNTVTLSKLCFTEFNSFNIVQFLYRYLFLTFQSSKHSQPSAKQISTSLSVPHKLVTSGLHFSNEKRESLIPHAIKETYHPPYCRLYIFLWGGTLWMLLLLLERTNNVNSLQHSTLLHIIYFHCFV